LEDTFLHNIPILVVGNKIDIKGHMSEKDIIEGSFAFGLKKIRLEFGLFVFEPLGGDYGKCEDGYQCE
jgi:GTPase SAR1 family protein